MNRSQTLKALALIAVLAFGLGEVYTTNQANHRLAARLQVLARKTLDLERLNTAELDLFTRALTADEDQLRALNQKPVATIAEVRAALIALQASIRQSTTTTRPTTRPTTATTRGATTTTTTTTVPPPTTTTTRCRRALRLGC